MTGAVICTRASSRPAVSREGVGPMSSDAAGARKVEVPVRLLSAKVSSRDSFPVTDVYSENLPRVIPPIPFRDLRDLLP